MYSFLALLLALTHSEVGFDYDDSDQTIITRVFFSNLNETDVIIPAKVSKIVTGDLVTGAFVPVKDKITSISFYKGSELQEIGSYFLSESSTLVNANFSECTKVKTIKSYAFQNCISLQNIDFPPNLETVGSFSFGCCSSLQNFELPNSTLTIHESGFRECQSITKFSVPQKLQSFGTNSLYKCKKLAEIVYPPNTVLKSFGGWMFMETSLKELYIPSSIETIGSSIVEGNANIKRIVLQEPSKFSVVDSVLLFNMDQTILYFGLASISGTLKIPNGTKELLGNCLKLCSPTEVIFPDTLTTLGGNGHLAGCYSLVTVTLSKKLSRISAEMFMGDNKLQSLVIPEGPTMIGDKAFQGCRSLASLTIPASVTTVYHGIFTGVPSNIQITFGPGSSMVQDGKFIYSLNHSTLVSYLGNDESVTIHPDTKQINGYTFSDKQLKKITFLSDNTLQSLGDYAFARCSNLESISLPSSVKSIGLYCFQSCTKLNSIILPRSLQGISEYAFNKANVGVIFIPSSVESIDKYSFESSRVTKVTFEEGSKLKSIGEMAFSSTNVLEYIEFVSELDSLGSQVFYQSSVVSVLFKQTSKLKIIPAQTFYQCQKLKYFTFPSGCEEILDGAFEGCSSLEVISLPESLVSISYRAFAGCSKLSSFSIPSESRLDNILGQAFEGCTSLTDFHVMPDSGFVSENGILYDRDKTQIFAYLSASPLLVLNIEEGVQVIKKFVFQGASNIENISIPGSVVLIDMMAFQGCSGLVRLEIMANSQLKLMSESFGGCINLGCDSVVILEGTISRSEFETAGIPLGALEHCPSTLFSARSDIVVCGYISLPLVIADDE